MTIEKYIVVKDNKIIGCFETNQGKNGVLASIKDTPYDSIEQVDIEGDHRVQTFKDEYNDKHKFKSLKERVSLGRIKIPEGHKLDGENIRAMNLQEKVEAKLIEANPLLVYEGDTTRLKTEEELISTGVKTKKQIDEEKLILEEEKMIQAELRKLAISNLGNKLSKVKA